MGYDQHNISLSQHEPVDDKLYLGYGILEIISSSLGLFLNVSILPYFLCNRHGVSGLLYVLIIINDIVICFSCIPSAVSMMSSHKAMWLESRVFCTLTGYGFNVATRMSVFLIATLSVARSLSLSLPFVAVRPIHVVVIVGFYYAINFLVAALPIVFGDGYQYEPFYGFCFWTINSLSFIKSVHSKLFESLTYGFIILPWLVPGMVVTVSCFVSLYYIRASHVYGRCLARTMSQKVRNSLLKRSATITIFVMTIVYIIFNMPCWAFYILVLCHIKYNIPWLQSRPAIYTYLFVVRLSVVINSFCNPIVYIWRISKLRRFYADKVCFLAGR